MLVAFGVSGEEPKAIGRPGSWRCGEVVLRQVIEPAEVAWMARAIDDLQVDGVRLARAVRSTDGRWVVGGWTATRHLAGRPEPRHDEIVALSLRLHEATRKLPRPDWLGARADLWATADRMAWGEQDTAELTGKGAGLFTDLAGERTRLDLPAQLVHGDLFGNVLFAGDAPPAVVDFTPFWRPAEWAAAVVVVDALAWGGADLTLAARWSVLPGWSQCLLRALLSRIAAHTLHPRSTAESWGGLLRAVEVVSGRL